MIILLGKIPFNALTYIRCLVSLILPLQVHVSKESSIPDHCRAYALSDPNDKDYQIKCGHDHLDVCDRCEILASVLSDIREAIERMSASNISRDIIEELTFTETQAKKNILAWKSHLLRCVNQDEARVQVIEALDESSVFLVQDWAMKFLPRKFRESQRDWFAKRGMSWHITVATRKAENREVQMMSFVHVFQTCSQGSCAVVSIMKDVIGKLKSRMPQLESVFYRQDNAGCYHCGATIVGASFACQCHGVALKRMDFSDPQGGKGACDRKAASIKSHMRVYLNQGVNIETSQEMVDAIQSSGGVPGVCVTLCDSVKVPKPPLNVKLDGISLISNIEYNLESLRVWKAYGIGPGKKIQLNELGVPQSAQVPDLVISVEDTAEQTPEVQFIKVKSRIHRSENTEKSGSDVEDEPATDTSNTAVSLFSCPEEGCVKAYQRFSSLQRHLDIGKHERALEHETLLDRAVHGYAHRLQEQSCSTTNAGG